MKKALKPICEHCNSKLCTRCLGPKESSRKRLCNKCAKRTPVTLGFELVR